MNILNGKQKKMIARSPREQLGENLTKKICLEDPISLRSDDGENFCHSLPRGSSYIIWHSEITVEYVLKSIQKFPRNSVHIVKSNLVIVVEEGQCKYGRNLNVATLQYIRSGAQFRDSDLLLQLSSNLEVFRGKISVEGLRKISMEKGILYSISSLNNIEIISVSKQLNSYLDLVGVLSNTGEINFSPQQQNCSPYHHSGDQITRGMLLHTIKKEPNSPTSPLYIVLTGYQGRQIATFGPSSLCVKCTTPEGEEVLYWTVLPNDPLTMLEAKAFCPMGILPMQHDPSVAQLVFFDQPLIGNTCAPSSVWEDYMEIPFATILSLAEQETQKASEVKEDHKQVEVKFDDNDLLEHEDIVLDDFSLALFVFTVGPLSERTKAFLAESFENTSHALIIPDDREGADGPSIMFMTPPGDEPVQVVGQPAMTTQCAPSSLPLLTYHPLRVVVLSASSGPSDASRSWLLSQRGSITVCNAIIIQETDIDIPQSLQDNELDRTVPMNLPNLGPNCLVVVYFTKVGTMLAMNSANISGTMRNMTTGEEQFVSLPPTTSGEDVTDLVSLLLSHGYDDRAKSDSKLKSAHEVYPEWYLPSGWRFVDNPIRDLSLSSERESLRYALSMKSSIAQTLTIDEILQSYCDDDTNSMWSKDDILKVRNGMSRFLSDPEIERFRSTLLSKLNVKEAELRSRVRNCVHEYLKQEEGSDRQKELREAMQTMTAACKTERARLNEMYANFALFSSARNGKASANKSLLFALRQQKVQAEVENGLKAIRDMDALDKLLSDDEVAGLTVSVSLHPAVMEKILGGMESRNQFQIMHESAPEVKLGLTDQPFDTMMTTCALIEATKNTQHRFSPNENSEINFTIPVRKSANASALLVVLPDALDLPDIHHQKRKVTETEATGAYPSQSGTFNAAVLGVDMPVMSALRVISRHFLANSRMSKEIFHRNAADPWVTWGLASLYLYVAEALAERTPPSAVFEDGSTKMVRIALLNAMVVLGSGTVPVTYSAWRILGDAKHRPAEIQRSGLADWVVLYRVMKIFHKTLWPPKGAVKMTRWFLIALLNRVYVEPLAKLLVNDAKTKRQNFRKVQQEHLEELKSGPFSTILRSMVDLVLLNNGQIDLPEVKVDWERLLLQMDEAVPAAVQSNRSARRRSVYALRLPLGAHNPYRGNRLVTAEEKVDIATEIMTRWVKRGWWIQSPQAEAIDQVMYDGNGKEIKETMTVSQELMLRARSEKLEIDKEFALAAEVGRRDELVCRAVDFPGFVEHLAVHLNDLDDKASTHAGDVAAQVNYCSYLLKFAGLGSLELVAAVVKFLFDEVRADGVAREEKAMQSLRKHLHRLYSKARAGHESVKMEEEDEDEDDEKVDQPEKLG